MSVRKMVKIRLSQLRIGLPLRRRYGNSSNSKPFSKLKKEQKSFLANFGTRQRAS